MRAFAGCLAQLVERRPYKANVGGSIPSAPTSREHLQFRHDARSRRKFDANRGVVVQLVRIPACHAGGRGFESRPLRQHRSRANASSPFSRIAAEIAAAYHDGPRAAMFDLVHKHKHVAQGMSRADHAAVRILRRRLLRSRNDLGAGDRSRRVGGDKITQAGIRRRCSATSRSGCGRSLGAQLRPGDVRKSRSALRDCSTSSINQRLLDDQARARPASASATTQFRQFISGTAAVPGRRQVLARAVPAGAVGAESADVARLMFEQRRAAGAARRRCRSRSSERSIVARRHPCERYLCAARAEARGRRRCRSLAELFEKT